MAMVVPGQEQLTLRGSPWSGQKLQRGQPTLSLWSPPLALLVTLACEIGGRWSEGTIELVEQLAKARARGEPRRMQVAAQHAFAARWWALLSCAQQEALAASLLGDGLPLLDGHDGHGPIASEVMVDERAA